MRFVCLVAVICQASFARADDGDVYPHDAPPIYEPDPPHSQWLQPWTFGITSFASEPMVGTTFGATAEYAPTHWLVLSSMLGANDDAPTGGVGARLRAPIGDWAISGGLGLIGVGERHASDDRSNWLSGTDTLAYDFAPTLLGSAEVSLEVRKANGLGGRLGIGVATPIAGGGYRCTETTIDNGLLSGVVDGVADGVASSAGTSGPMPGAVAMSDCGGSVSVALYAGLTLTYTPRLR